MCSADVLQAVIILSRFMPYKLKQFSVLVNNSFFERYLKKNLIKSQLFEELWIVAWVPGEF